MLAFLNDVVKQPILELKTFLEIIIQFFLRILKGALLGHTVQCDYNVYCGQDKTRQKCPLLFTLQQINVLCALTLFYLSMYILKIVNFCSLLSTAHN